MIFIDSNFKVKKIEIENYDFKRVFPWNINDLILIFGFSSGMLNNIKDKCDRGEYWVANSPMKIIVHVTNGNGRNVHIVYHIKRGWVTDMASVPDCLRGFVDNDSNEIVIPAICHDIAYALHGLCFDDANVLFREMLKYFDMSLLKRWLAYWAVSSPVGRMKYDDTLGMNLHKKFVSMEI